MKKVLFIDRDGTLIIEPQMNKSTASKSWSFIRGLSVSFAHCQRTGIRIGDGNQSGRTGYGCISGETFWPVQNKIIRAFENEGVVFDDILIDRSFPEDNAPTRKPRTGLLTHYLKGNYDLANSFVVGDRETDVSIGRKHALQSHFFKR